MNAQQLQLLWSDILCTAKPSPGQFEGLALAVAETFGSGDPQFRQHIEYRFKRVTLRTGQPFDSENFDEPMSRAFVADEMGFSSWDELLSSLTDPAVKARPILFQYAVAAMDMGNFTALETTIGGPDRFHDQIVNWYEAGLFRDESETLAEIFAAACMLGHAKTAGYLLDKGVDPYAGMKTGLAGFHYAVSSGRLDVVRLLIAQKVPTEIRNMYGGTVWEQALWSAVHEHKHDHAAIIEALVDSGVEIEPGTLDWWDAQDVPSDETKVRVADALRRRDIK